MLRAGLYRDSAMLAPMCERVRERRGRGAAQESGVRGGEVTSLQ